MSGISKRVNGSWVSGDERVMKTATDTITTLPADLYADGTAATIGLKGNMSQTGTPTPQNPIQPQETGERTAQLFDENNATFGYWTSRTGQTSSAIYGAQYRIDLTNISTLTVKANGDAPYTFSFCWYQSDDTFISREHYSTEITAAKTATVPNNAAYVVYQVSCPTGSRLTPQLLSSFKIMLNTGSTALPHEPYGIKIPISSANTTTPVYLGEVQSTRQIFKVVFDGTENWTEYGSGSSRFFYTSLSTQGYNDSKLVMSTHFQYTAGSSAAYSISLASNGTMLRIYDRETNWADATTFKSWLAAQYSAGTPVTVWYVLATPTTGIVNEPLRKIGDYADEVFNVSIPVIAGANTLSVGTTVQPSEVTVNYKGWHTGAVHERESGQWD